jgi:hypothetical protein
MVGWDGAGEAVTESQVRIDRLLRKESRERLFRGTSRTGTRALVFQVPFPRGVLDERDWERLHKLGEAMGDERVGKRYGLLSWSFRKHGLEWAVEDPCGRLFSELMGLPLGVPVALCLWRRLLEALEAVHERGQGYGLCVPEKLILDPEGKVRFAEPCIAPVLSVLLMKQPTAQRFTTFQRLFSGASLVPPEMLKQGWTSPAGDVYQSAVLFWRLALGSDPYGAGSFLEICNRTLKGQSQRLGVAAPGASAGLEELVASCLKPDPAARPGSAGELLRRVDEIKDVRPAELDAPTAMEARSYSDRFSEILSVHAGGTVDGEDLEPAGEHDAQQAAEAERLLQQLDAMRAPGAVERPRGRRVFWLLVCGLLAVAAALLLPELLTERGVRQHEGTLPLDGDAMSHHRLVWDPSGAVPPHPPAEALMETVPLAVKEALRGLGLACEGALTLVEAGRAPYRVRVEPAGGMPLTYEFGAHGRLASVELPRALEVSKVARYEVLYDAAGQPAVLAAVDGTGARVAYTKVGGRKD